MGFPSVIAIDGPVASGKSTVGRAVARRHGYRFVDTGLMYRAVTLLAQEGNVSLEDGAALTRLAEETPLDVRQDGAGADQVFAAGADVTARLRTAEVEAGVSLVARVPGVRDALVRQQRRMAGEGRVVMVGRDIGTVVVPDAAKVYLDASPDERARRRHEELAGAGPREASLDAVKENLALRDRLDSEREASPLRVADGAVQVLTDDLDVDGVVERIERLLEDAGP